LGVSGEKQNIIEGQAFADLGIEHRRYLHGGAGG
jgi:hypothetical protein